MKQDNGNHAATPGPWIYRSPTEYDNPHIGWCIDSPDSELVAEVKITATVEANARLIAAAPELLEALEAIVDRMGQGFVPTRKLLTRGRDAIAKAKGD